MTKEPLSFPLLSSQPHYDESPKPYAYQYGVKDEYSGTNFNAQEQADGKVVTGQYQGRTQKALPLCHSSVKCLEIKCEGGRCLHVDRPNAYCSCRNNFVLNSDPEQNQAATSSLKKPTRKRFTDSPPRRRAPGRPRSPYPTPILTS